MTKAAAFRGRDGMSGQSVVEFAIVVPLLVVILLGIVDLARVYTTLLNVESASREAADFGTFGSQKWDSAVVSVPGGTEAEIKHRACLASSNLPDYVGSPAPTDTDDCVNPTVSYELSGDLGATWAPYSDAMGCDDPSREPPCWLKVTLEYDFKLIVPFHLEIFGNNYGVPETLSLARSSVFPMTDLDIP